MDKTLTLVFAATLLVIVTVVLGVVFSSGFEDAQLDLDNLKQSMIPDSWSGGEGEGSSQTSYISILHLSEGFIRKSSAGKSKSYIHSVLIGRI